MEPPVVRQRLEAKRAHVDPHQREQAMGNHNAMHEGPLIDPGSSIPSEEPIFHTTQVVVCSRLALGLPEREQTDPL